MIGVLFKINVWGLKMDPIRVMIYADTYAATSGYSKVGNALAKRLAKMKDFEVYFQQIVSIDPVTKEDDVILLPSFADRNSSFFINTIVNNIRMITPNVFIPISDIFLMRRDNLHKLNFHELKFMPYVLIDSIGIPDYSNEVLDKAHHIFSAHEFGYDQLQKEGYDSEILYHGVDNSYKEISKAEQISLRRSFLIPDDNKVFFFCGRNFMRKRPYRLLEAIAKLNKHYQDNNKDNDTTFLLHISDHTSPNWNLEEFVKRLAKEYDISMDNIIFTKEHKLGQGMREDDFVKLYQMSDFYISAASGEGFGLPIIEAMSCGKLVIAPKNTTHTKFLQERRGLLVDNDSQMYVGFGSKQDLVNINKLTESMLEAIKINKTKIGERYRNNAKQFVNKNCDWDQITLQLANSIKKVVNNGK